MPPCPGFTVGVGGTTLVLGPEVADPSGALFTAFVPASMAGSLVLAQAVDLDRCITSPGASFPFPGPGTPSGGPSRGSSTPESPR